MKRSIKTKSLKWQIKSKGYRQDSVWDFEEKYYEADDAFDAVGQYCKDYYERKAVISQCELKDHYLIQIVDEAAELTANNLVTCYLVTI